MVTSLRLECTQFKGLLMMTKNSMITGFLVGGFIMWCSCSKPADGNSGAYKLSYGDSILYLRSTGNNIVNPTEYRPGSYTGFPEGIEIDENTGAINLSNSETGLRYRITHRAPDGTETRAIVVISGITFSDKFYHLSTGDSIAPPVYNASEVRSLPLAGSNFDEGNTANSGGCSVRTDNGKINLAQCVRNGIFGSTPLNDERRDFEIAYRLNDGSNKVLNKIKVRIYYYDRMSDVAPDLLQTLQDRESLGVFLRNNNSVQPNTSSRASATAKPRPPCVIIVNQ